MQTKHFIQLSNKASENMTTHRPLSEVYAEAKIMASAKVIVLPNDIPQKISHLP